jgi:hypothetical protein
MKTIIEKIAEYNSKHRKNEASVTLSCCPTRPGGEIRIVSDSIYLVLKCESRTEPDRELITVRLQSDGSFPEVEELDGFAIPDMNILIDYFQLAKEIDEILREEGGEE